MFTLSPEILELMAYAILLVISTQLALMLLYIYCNMSRQNSTVNNRSDNHTPVQRRQSSRQLLRFKLLKAIYKLERQTQAKKNTPKSSELETNTVNTFSCESSDTLPPIANSHDKLEVNSNSKALVPVVKPSKFINYHNTLLAITDSPKKIEENDSNTQALAIVPSNAFNLEDYHSESDSQIIKPITYDSCNKLIEEENEGIYTEHDSTKSSISDNSDEENIEETDFVGTSDPNVGFIYDDRSHEWKSTSSEEDISRKFNYVKDSERNTSEEDKSRTEHSSSLTNTPVNIMPTKFKSDNMALIKKDNCIRRAGLSKRPSFKYPTRNKSDMY